MIFLSRRAARPARANDSTAEAFLEFILIRTEEFVTEIIFSAGMKKRTPLFFDADIILLLLCFYFPRMIDPASPQPAQRADYCELDPIIL